jgi:hypothetical protein
MAEDASEYKNSLMRLTEWGARRVRSILVTT